jgi:viroplasmin and RNaseH domain-containing protein
MSYYAVANGRNVGIFLNWNDCNNSVKGYKNALYKKFDTKQEADNFIQTNEKNINDTNIQKQNNITSFFHMIKSKEKDDDTVILFLIQTIMFIQMGLVLIMDKITPYQE